MEFDDIWLAVVKLAVDSARAITDDQKALEIVEHLCITTWQTW